MQTYYEWDFEEVDQFGDIVDHDFTEQLRSNHTPDILDTNAGQNDVVLTLIRNVGNDYDGIVEREWAYTQRNSDGMWFLPMEFDGGSIVPKRFHAELSKWIRNQ